MMNQLEKVTKTDLNGDGRIGGGAGHGQPQQHQGGGAAHGQQHRQGGGGLAGGLMNQLEKATHMDLNGDGRVGGNSGAAPRH